MQSNKKLYVDVLDVRSVFLLYTYKLTFFKRIQSVYVTERETKLSSNHCEKQIL